MDKLNTKVTMSLKDFEELKSKINKLEELEKEIAKHINIEIEEDENLEIKEFKIEFDGLNFIKNNYENFVWRKKIESKFNEWQEWLEKDKINICNKKYNNFNMLTINKYNDLLYVLKQLQELNDNCYIEFDNGNISGKIKHLNNKEIHFFNSNIDISIKIDNIKKIFNEHGKNLFDRKD